MVPRSQSVNNVVEQFGLSIYIISLFSSCLSILQQGCVLTERQQERMLVHLLFYFVECFQLVLGRQLRLSSQGRGVPYYHDIICVASNFSIRSYDHLR